MRQASGRKPASAFRSATVVVLCPVVLASAGTATDDDKKRLRVVAALV